jgi:autotransporter-associated beta strand protein/T5SS/PEP-CTERM-associated repeat protein
MLRLVPRFALFLLAFASFAAPATAQTAIIGYSWQGATLRDEGAGWPPDTHGSVGINHFVQSVNGGFQMYNKDGTGYTYPANYISNHTFWTSKVGVATGVTGSNYTDPRVYYDPRSQRWFAVEITIGNGPNGGNNRILIGRSDTSDPRGSWHGLTVSAPASNQFMDFPTLAVDANGVYVGTNNFGGSGSRSLVSVPLASFLANPATTMPTTFHNPSGSSNMGLTLHGVTDLTGGTVGATAAIVFGTGVSNTTLSRTIVDNPAGTATLTMPTSGNGGLITVLPAATSINAAPQQGGPPLDNGDNRIGSAIYRVGNLIYMSRAVDSGDGTGRSVARWTVLSVNNATNAVTVVREGTIDLGASTHAFYPSIAANERGDFVLSFSRSSSFEYPSIWAVVGTTADHSNWSVGAPIRLQAGITFQDITNITSNRWGDYSATTLDPADPGSFWVTNEYMHNVDPPGSLTANQNWATQVVEVIPVIAGESRWKDPAGGPFATAGNWLSGAVPGSTDHVIFSRWSGNSYQVDIPAAATTTNDRLSVRQTGTGTVTFNIASGATWSLTNPSATTPSLAISEYQGQSSVVVTGGGTLLTNHAIIAGQSGGTGNLTITGAGTTWTNANDLFVGGTSAASGGTGSLTVSAGATVNVGGTLKLWNSASGVSITGAGSALSVAGLANQTGTTPTVTIGASAALNVTDGLGTTFSGTISGAGVLTKSGPGTFTLTGNNTYGGQTTVNNGTLFVNGQSGANSGTGSGPVVVNGGTLGGTGRIGGTVTVNSTARLAPGASVGILTVAGNTVFNLGGKLAVEVDASGTNDHLALEGNSTTLDFRTGSILELSLLGGFSVSSPATYSLASLVNGDNILIDGVTVPNGGVLGTFIQGVGASGAVTIQPSGASLVDGNQFLLVRSGNTLELQYQPVPEPATILAVGFAALAAGALVRRRSRESSVISHQ